jgi:signal transduction histidine kinase
MSKKQIAEISKLLLEYSSGNYLYQGEISDEVNDLDMIVSGINMLGEELESTNVSRDYFSSIFNAVTDLVMIVNKEGLVTDANLASDLALASVGSEIRNTALNELLIEKELFEQIKVGLEKGKAFITKESTLKGNQENLIYGLLTCSKIIDRYEKFQGYLISIKDITEQKENEKLILKTIFTTQQIEQKRVADDLHDSLGQELSMTKLMISNLKALSEGDKKQVELINTCTDILDNSIQHLREICFNLMPSVLSRGGLDLAITDLIKKLSRHESLKVNYSKNKEVARMDSDLEVVMYRIVQEFINNMIKHAEATLLTIDIFVDSPDKFISLTLNDNGKGFEMKQLKNIGENRGYQNLQSKVKAFSGELNMKSTIGEGTMTKVKFPLISINE